jgi:hypothetical protein
MAADFGRIRAFHVHKMVHRGLVTNLQISEVRLPELVRRRRLILELVCSLHQDEGWAGNQIMGLEETEPEPPLICTARCLRNFDDGHSHSKHSRMEPFTDMAIDANGCRRWNTEKYEMHECVRGYFVSCSEDG